MRAAHQVNQYQQQVSEITAEKINLQSRLRVQKATAGMPRPPLSELPKDA